MGAPILSDRHRGRQLGYYHTYYGKAWRTRVLAAGASGDSGEGFCIVNGGDRASWLCSFVAGAFIFAIRRQLAAWKFNIRGASTSIW